MTNEELVRDYLNSLDLSEISDSVHLVDLNFERSSYSEILDAIYSLYLDVAKISKFIVNNLDKKENLDENKIVDEFKKKSKVLDKILSFKPIYDDLTKFINAKNNNLIKKTS